MGRSTLSDAGNDAPGVAPAASVFPPHTPGVPATDSGSGIRDGVLVNSAGYLKLGGTGAASYVVAAMRGNSSYADRTDALGADDALSGSAHAVVAVLRGRGMPPGVRAGMLEGPAGEETAYAPIFGVFGGSAPVVALGVFEEMPEEKASMTSRGPWVGTKPGGKSNSSAEEGSTVMGT